MTRTTNHLVRVSIMVAAAIAIFSLGGCGSGTPPGNGNGNGTEKHANTTSAANRLAGGQREGIPLSGVELGYGWDN